MRKVIVLLDCPLSENDKNWIESLSVEGYDTILYGVDERLSQLVHNGIKGRIKNYWLQLKQVLKVLFVSNKEDIIVVWYSVTGQIINILSYFFGGRMLILMNFLTPSRRRGIIWWMLKMTVNNSNNSIFVNSRESIDQYKQMFCLEEESSAKFYYFPDVYDGEECFRTPSYIEEVKERYFFIGGMSNRDWELAAEVSRKMPLIRFVCVALKSDFDQQVKDTPSNMDVCYNLPAEEYYKKMREAYCVLLPLKNNAVAGLITILKSIQYGIPCCVSKTQASSQYYPEELNYYLVEHTIDAWCTTVRRFMNMSKLEYEANMVSHQFFVKKEFSPATALSRIKDVVLFMSK